MKSNRIALCSAAAVAMLSAGSALAGVNSGPTPFPGQVSLLFTELLDANGNDAGIALSGYDWNGAPINAPTVTGETYNVGVPYPFNNAPADYRMNHIGITQTASYYLVNIMEQSGGDGDSAFTLSDQIYVYRDSGNNTHIAFISDPDQFVTLNPMNTIIENGNVQFGFQYTTDAGGGQGNASPVLIWFQSDIPTPGAAALLGLGGLIAGRRRRA